MGMPTTVGLATMFRRRLGTAPATTPTNGGYLFGRPATYRTFGLLCLLMAFDFADRMILAALLPGIQADWHISDTVAGLLSSVLTLGMVLFAFPASIVIDRWSRIKTASLMGIFWGIASMAGAFSQSVAQLLASRLLVGVGEAGYAPASYAWITAAFPYRRRQFALGLFSAAQPVGMALGVALGGYVASHYDWRTALGVLAVPGVIVAVWLYGRRDYKNFPRISRGEGDQRIPTRAGSVLQSPSLLLSYVGAAMGTLQWVPVIFFLPTYLNRVHSVPLSSASLMVSGALLLSIIGVPLGGWAMDHWNRRDDRAKLIYPLFSVTVSTLLYGVAFGIAEDAATQYAILVAAFFIGSTGGTGPLTLTQELVHPAIRAFSGTCSIVLIHLLGSVPGPFIVGFLSDRYGLPTALLGVVLVAGTLEVVSLAAALKYYRRDRSRVGDISLEAE